MSNTLGKPEAQRTHYFPCPVMRLPRAEPVGTIRGICPRRGRPTTTTKYRNFMRRLVRPILPLLCLAAPATLTARAKYTIGMTKRTGTRNSSINSRLSARPTSANVANPNASMMPPGGPLTSAGRGRPGQQTSDENRCFQSQGQIHPHCHRHQMHAKS